MIFTREQLALFRKAESTRDADACSALHESLDRRPWHEDVTDCAAAEPHPSIARLPHWLAAYQEAHQIYVALKEATNQET
jgi:hypothetical protein